jgi:uncharacterized protein (TIGR02266 family)
VSDRTESRKFHRAPVSVEVQYRTKGSFLVSYSLNLSKGGIFLETSDLYPIGTELTVRFSIPGTKTPIETRARVMWVRRKTSDEGLPPGLGLQFDMLEEHIGKIIDRLVQDFAGVKLLAVADDPSALERLTRYLQSILTCEVIQTSSAEILATGFHDRIDLTMLDLDSSGESGQILIQIAHKTTKPPIPVIGLSKSPIQQAMALKEGAAAVLENPPAYEQLRECVLSVLGKPYRLG